MEGFCQPGFRREGEHLGRFSFGQGSGRECGEGGAGDEKCACNLALLRSIGAIGG